MFKDRLAAIAGKPAVLILRDAARAHDRLAGLHALRDVVQSQPARRHVWWSSPTLHAQPVVALVSPGRGRRSAK